MDTALHMKEEDIPNEFISEDNAVNNPENNSPKKTVDDNSKNLTDTKIVDYKNMDEKEFTLELIDVYRNLPSLWNNKHKHHMNKNKRREDFDILLNKYREKYPNANRTVVIKKIKNLRSVYRRELKRCPPNVVSRLYYFESMDFLKDNYLAEKKISFKVCNNVKTQIDADVANNSNISTSDPNGIHYKNTVKKKQDGLNSEQKFVIELIELYRTLPALWDKKCIQYNDRESKAIQYNILLEKYKERYPDANKDDIKRKMKSLRLNMGKELKRPSRTKLYYFDALRFICNTDAQSENQNLLNDLDDTSDISMDGDNEERTDEISEIDSGTEYTEISKEQRIEQSETEHDLDNEQNEEHTNKRKFIIEFLNLYRTLPALWDFNNASYQNREIKNKQYEIMLTKYREIMPNANIFDVKKKIATLRSNFQREVKRLSTSKLKQPALFYYDAISFIRKNDSECDGQDRMDDLNEDEDISMEGNKIESTKEINENENISQCAALTEENQFIIEFINLYRSLPALWDMNIKSYYDRNIRNRYYEVMLAKYREIMPNANMLDVKKKIAALRSNFQREVNRLRESNMEEPSLYYYDAMSFLRNNYSDCNKEMEQILDENGDYDSLDEIDDSEDDSFVEQTDFLLYTDEDTQDPIERKFTLELIEVYHSLPALWKRKNKHFFNREFRKTQYEILLTKYREMYPNAELKDVRSKIYSLRTNFCTELKRVGPKGTSNRYYFDALSFLRTNNKPVESLEKVKDTTNFVLDVKQLIILATIYKEHTCLWNEKDITYRFTNRRDEAMQFVCEKFNNKTGLNLTQIDLEKKVKTLRKLCSFIKNRKLVAKRKNLQYQLKFAYFKHLEFLEKDVGPFDCPTCKKIIHGPDAFKVHVAGHDGSLPFICDICGHGYQLSSNLAVHLRRHVHDYTYGCEICNKFCATSTDLKTHMRSHTEEKPFVCDLCGHRTGTSSHLLAHRRRHLKRRLYKCELCPKTFYDKQILKQHQKIHSSVRDKICDICNKGFITNNKLRQHRLIHDPEKKYSCKICGKRFAQSAGLCGHMKSHGNDTTNFVLDVEQLIILATIYKEHTCLWNEKDVTYRFTNRRDEAMRFVCEKFNNKTGLNLTQIDLEKKVITLRKLCSFMKNQKLVAKRKNLQYQLKPAYFKHLEFLENDVAPFDCPTCKKIITSPDAFKVHVASHDGSLPFICDICGHGFQLSSNLAVHLRRHVHDYTYRCGVCKKLYATSTELKIHMRLHTDEKPFVCDLCGFRTGTSSHLLTHRRRHHKQRLKVYKCELCPKTFYEKRTLHEHQNVHSAVRDKICDICNKGFINSKRLRQHRLIHDPEKKFSCKICGKRFAQSAGLCGHMKSHGNIK
ncbi:uncharacterized protein LOC105222953 isoform X3 [Bactrocera dorsalis]|nr:uncharacterized protein LOC105222953 isoform X3 [Bactrocera dorsalis]XP_049311618.1 uncharacterized protein LOC105222953 isoform X3 [Bactrocera dorsalis]